MNATPSSPAAAARSARSAHDSEWLDRAAKAGLVAYGVVHLLIAWLALQLAFGEKEESASNSGALQYLVEQPMGSVLVWLIAVGMALLVIWMGFEVAFGYDDVDDTTKRWRKRATAAGKGVIYAVLGVSAVKTATGSGSSGGGTDPTTAKLMDLPGGQLIVGAVGIAIICVGGYLTFKGWSEKFRKELDAEGTTGKDGSAIVISGKIGYIAKGVAIAIVGGLFVFAAIQHQPDESGGLDQALQKILEVPFGQVLLAAMALGIAGFGVFCFARARHLSR